MANEMPPIEAIKLGTADEKRFYLRKALWSDEGYFKAKNKIREKDLIFWLGGEKKMLTQVSCQSGGQVDELVEKFKDGILPDEGWQEEGICLDGMKLRITDKELNLLSDIVISKQDIERGQTTDGICLCYEGELLRREDTSPDKQEVLLEGVDEEATWSWTMHTEGNLDLSSLEIHYRKYTDENGDAYCLVDGIAYGNGELEAEFHQWTRSHQKRFYVFGDGGRCEFNEKSSASDVELRVALTGEHIVNIRAWRGSMSIPLYEIVRNRNDYAEQYKFLEDVVEAWDGNADEFLGAIDWYENLNISYFETLICFKSQLSDYEIRDYRSGDVLKREAEVYKIWSSEDRDVILYDIGWKPADGKDSAVKAIMEHYGVSAEIAEYAIEHEICEIPK